MVSGNLRQNLRALREALPELDRRYPNARTLVEVGWAKGQKFAKILGFRDTGLTRVQFGKTYNVMERPTWQ